MDGDSIFGTVVSIALVAYFFGISGENTRYQVANYGSSQAIVLDTKTGEAWISDSVKKYSYEIPALKPIQYVYKQSESKEFAVYTPDETRNESNSSWWSFLKRKFTSK